MQNRDHTTQSLISLYHSTPRMILYDKDLSIDDLDSDVHAVANTSSGTQLNPMEVVLESLINKLTEKISEENLTRSQDTVLLNSRFRRMAMERLVEQARADNQFLTEIHQAWLHELEEYVLHEMKGSLTADELVFRVAMRYRISTSSAARALKSTRRARSQTSET